MTGAATITRRSMRDWDADDWRVYRERLCIARMECERFMDPRWARIHRAFDLIYDISERLARKECPPWMASRRHHLLCWAMREMGIAPFHLISQVMWQVRLDADSNRRANRLLLGELADAAQQLYALRKQNEELRERIETLEAQRAATRSLFA